MKSTKLTEFVCALSEELSVVSEGEHTGLAQARVHPTRGRGHGGDGGEDQHQDQSDQARGGGV